MKSLRQHGFTAIEAIIIVVVLAGLAGVGYVFISMYHKATTPVASVTTTNGSTSQTASVSVPSAPQVKSSSDLNSALSTLNQVDLDAGLSDSSQLGSQSSAL